GWPAPQQHGVANDPPPDGPWRFDRAWLPLDLLGLVCRADEHPERGSRNGPGAHRERQGGSGVSSWRPVPEAAGFDGCLGKLLRGAGGGQHHPPGPQQSSPVGGGRLVVTFPESADPGPSAPDVGTPEDWERVEKALGFKDFDPRRRERLWRDIAV